MSPSGAESTIAVLDFGGQYAHLIANRVRRLGVYSEIRHNDTPAQALRSYQGIILSGGPSSVLDDGSPGVDPAIFDLPVPILGLCYGHQLMARMLDGVVKKGTVREYGLARLNITKPDPIFATLEPQQQIWMSHGDYVSRPPQGFDAIGATDDCAVAAMVHTGRRLYGFQFHPEVNDTPRGMDILNNFIDICGCRRWWNTDRFVDEISAEIKQKCGNRKVFLLVSGGVDSTVAFALLNKVLGPDRVQGLHIDNGLMRKNESGNIMEYLKAHGFNNLVIDDASDDFLRALSGLSDPEKKRQIIGDMFLQIKTRAQNALGLNADEWLLAQGTIYPDTIESAGTRHADKIKTHHNRVDIVLELLEKGLLVEPLAQLYKDEVRQVGERLGLPHSLVWRHPFPGPGLGVRVLCSDGVSEMVNPDAVDAVARMTRSFGYQGRILPLRSVGVQGDSRTYAHPALVDGVRDWAQLEELSTALTNKVAAVNRVVVALHQSSSEYRLVPAYVTRDRLDKLREVDHIVTEALVRSGEYDGIAQMPVVLLPIVNESGGECVVLRPLVTHDFMTARFKPLRNETLDAIVAQARTVKGIGDVFFDLTHKPPGTIEWE